MSGYRVSLGNIVRNIHFVDGNNNEIAGVWQNGSLTWSEMAEFMQIVFEKPIDEYAPFRCLEQGDPAQPLQQHGPPIMMQGNINQIQVGFYIILDPQGRSVDIPINRQIPTPRTASRSSSGPENRDKIFRDRVRERDGRCVITGTEPARGHFHHLNAAHIFPLANLDIWKAESWQRQITDDKYVGDSGITSIQNGILLRADVHALFDAYDIAINPDNGYKSYCFFNNPALDNLIMFRNPGTAKKYQPCRGLLKHHFRMAVLLNMKGRAGYPQWDEDLPRRGDDVAEIAGSEEGKLRFETVIASKLNSLIA